MRVKSIYERRRRGEVTGRREALEGLAAMRVQFHLLDAPEPLSWTLIYPLHGELGGGYYFIFIFIT